MTLRQRFKLALAALLGFSTACSSVKNAPKRAAVPSADPAPSEEEASRIVAMYGVRSPLRVIQQAEGADSLAAGQTTRSEGETVQTVEELPAIRVMYGPPRPRPVTPVERRLKDSLTRIYEASLRAEEPPADSVIRQMQQLIETLSQQQDDEQTASGGGDNPAGTASGGSEEQTPQTE